MPHILTLSTLFPNAVRPNFGIFVERQTAQLARREGFRVTVVNPVGMPPWPLSMAGPYRAQRALPRMEHWHGLTVHRPRFPLIPKIGGRLNPMLIARDMLPLVRSIHARHSIDLIAAEFFYPDGPAAMRIAGALGLPFTVKARGSDVHFWGGLGPARAQMLAAASEAVGLLAVSGALKTDMAALGMDADKIRVHYTGCDQTRFTIGDRRGAKAALGIDGPVVATLGALIPIKGQALVIRALAALPGRTLLVIGDGPERSRLEALAAECGVAERTRFLGAVPHDTIPDLLRAADAMCLPSQREGLANVWIESLACGTPLVISDVGGAREVVRSDTAGRIVARDPEAIAAALHAILTAPRAPESVRAEAAYFTWQRNGDELAQFYREMLGSNG